MNDVQFDEPQYNMPRPQVRHNSVVDFLLERGWAKDEKQAVHILFGVIGACILVSFWFFTRNNSEVEIPRGADIVNSPDEPPKLAEPLM